jgi:hypothetical protein
MNGNHRSLNRNVSDPRRGWESVGIGLQKSVDAEEQRARREILALSKAPKAKGQGAYQKKEGGAK